MVRDYETPTVPPAWQAFADRWAGRLGLSDKHVALVCSPDRYGGALVLRLQRPTGEEYVATRRTSEAEDAAERRRNFLNAVATRGFDTIEVDVAGYYIGEGAVPCPICGGGHEEWQHAVLRELLRVAEPPAEPAGARSDEEADEAEQAALDRRVKELLAGAK
jgi:hypothetical protein